MTDTDTRLVALETEVPIVAGDAFVDEDGAAHHIRTVTVTIRAADGTTRTVELKERGGRWWGPTSLKR